MGQIVKGKKKGRPSKADLARRAAAAPDLRRSLRRRSLRYSYDEGDDDFEEDEGEEEEEDEDEDERRRKKKLKLVLEEEEEEEGAKRRRRGASRGHAPAPSVSASSSENKQALKKRRTGGGYGGNDCGEEEEVEEEDDDEERGRQGADLKGGDSAPGTPSNSNPHGIPLPDKKTLEFILDKLQKKDTYGVYAEPVDPEELPDYHDMIDHPMDFATLRKNLAGGSYNTLQQFESDVFLICLNAMQYNSPETIYYKQARAIQELAKKKFERLRVDIERSEKEVKSEHKTKSNSLPRKQIKKAICRTAQEHVGSDFSSGATLAGAGDVRNCLNACQGAEKPNNIDGFVEGNSSLVDQNPEKAEDIFSGRSISYKFGKKSLREENRRATYNVSNQSLVKPEPVFSFFEEENKQLVSVGLHAEYSYARSLARFAATLGPVAWRVASKRIEQVLPAGFRYGRGWVGEYEPLPTAVLMLQTRSHQEPALLEKFQCVTDRRQDEKVSKGPCSAREAAFDRDTIECNLPYARSAGSRPATSPSHSGKPHNLPFRGTVEAKNMQVELNHPPSANQNATDMTTRKQQIPIGSEMVPSGSMETVLRSKNLSQSASFKQPVSNGVVFGAMPNGNVISNNLDNTRTVSLPSNSYPDRTPMAAPCSSHEQEQGFSDPVQVMKMLAEKANRQPNSLNPSAVDTTPVAPTLPALTRDDSTSAVGAAWISIGAGGCRPNTESLSTQKSQISADSLYNPTREFYSQTVQPRSEFPLAMHVQSAKSNSPFQAFVPQSLRTSNEGQFHNRPMVCPQLVTADLSRFQMQSPTQGFSPCNRLRQNQESLPPDLNIVFQSSGSPVRQSGVLADSQQPDLALQL